MDVADTTAILLFTVRKSANNQGSQQPVASNSHAQLPSYSEIWLFVSPVSRFTVNKKAQITKKPVSRFTVNKKAQRWARREPVALTLTALAPQLSQRFGCSCPLCLVSLLTRKPKIPRGSAAYRGSDLEAPPQLRTCPFFFFFCANWAPTARETSWPSAGTSHGDDEVYFFFPPRAVARSLAHRPPARARTRALAPPPA